MSQEKLVTIMDVAWDHANRVAHCGCVICRCARQAQKIQFERERKEAETKLTERLMKEWP